MPNDLTGIRNFITQTDREIERLLDVAIESGMTPRIKKRMEALENELKFLKLREEQMDSDGHIDRAKFVERLKADAERIDHNFAQRRAVIREYVKKVIITDERVVVRCTGDYSTFAGGATQI